MRFLKGKNFNRRANWRSPRLLQALLTSNVDPQLKMLQMKISSKFYPVGINIVPRIRTEVSISS